MILTPKSVLILVKYNLIAFINSLKVTIVIYLSSILSYHTNVNLDRKNVTSNNRSLLTSSINGTHET